MTGKHDPYPKQTPPIIGSLIEEMLANAEKHYKTIQKAKGRPLCLRDKGVSGCR